MSILDNIAKGEWISETGSKWPFPTWIKNENDILIAKIDMYHYSTSDNSIEDVVKRDPMNKTVLANSKLIADAGTTANKCGLLPSELLQQNTELLEALKEVVFDYKCILSSGACQAEAERGLLEKIDKLIQKYETK